MLSVQDKTVREIALEMPVTTRVFEEFKIDYCCHGNMPFDEACRKAGASPDVVMNRMASVLNVGNESELKSIADLTLSDLIGYILDKHHVYTKDEMGHLGPLIDKVVLRHSDHNRYLIELKALFQALCDDLEPHMMKEEMVLFPYIQNLDHCHRHHLTAPIPPFGTVQNPVNMMTVEHDAVGVILTRMRTVTNDYKLPEEACPSFTALYHRLSEFERDLHQHIHLENNLLFPRAIELEQEMIR